MIAMVVTIYDGILSLIFQPIMAAITSALAVGLGLLFGLIFLVPCLGKIWRSSWVWAAIIASVCVLILCFGSGFGVTKKFTDRETGLTHEGLRPSVALASYLVLIFTVVNWPMRKPNV